MSRNKLLDGIRSSGGRGKKGGLSEYAERVGKSKQYVSQLKDAAEVLAANRQVDLTVFLDRAQHLAALHKLPRACWPAAVEWLAAPAVQGANLPLERRPPAAGLGVAETDAGAVDSK